MDSRKVMFVLGLTLLVGPAPNVVAQTQAQAERVCDGGARIVNDKCPEIFLSHNDAGSPLWKSAELERTVAEENGAPLWDARTTGPALDSRGQIFCDGVALGFGAGCQFVCLAGDLVGVAFTGAGTIEAVCPGASARCQTGLAIRCEATSRDRIAATDRGRCLVSGIGTYSCFNVAP